MSPKNFLNKIFCYAAGLAILLLSSCEKEPAKTVSIPPDNSSEGMLICNEGNFNWANASLSHYNFKSNTIANDVFKQTNNRNLGDVLQSTTIINDKIYLVVNNSGKIEVLNKADFKSVATITNLRSPRYLMPVNDSMAYVSDLYDNAISVINLRTNSVVLKIPLPGWSEEMLLLNRKVFVTNALGEYLSVIDAAVHTLEDSIYCGYGSKSLIIDQQNQIWVLCEGDATKNKQAKLVCINGASKQILKSFTFNSGQPLRLRIGSNQQLYWINNNNVYTMNIADTSLPAAALILGSGKTLYGIAVNNKLNKLIVTNAKDYVSRGEVLIYSLNGILEETLNAGIIPSEITFISQP